MKINRKTENPPQSQSDGGEVQAEKKDRRQLRHGSYSVALIVIVIAAVLAVNLIVGQLPSQFTQIDLTGDQLSVLTDTTKEVVGALTEDVTIYYIVQDSDKDETVARLLERYDGLSSHVTVVERDPVLYPQFTSAYTDETLTDNSLIIVCGDKSRVISYYDLYEFEFSYSYYSYTATGFDAEGQITGAIVALTSEDLPKLYTVNGHGEMDLTNTLTQLIEKENIEMEELNLMTLDAVPEDADCLLIASPTSDLSATDAQKIINYLRRGGSAIIITDYTTEEMPNLAAVLEYYGTQIVEGIVVEGDSSHYLQSPAYLIPTINSTEVSSDMSEGNAYVLLGDAQGIERTEDAREDLQISSVLSTSSSAYSKTNLPSTTILKESGDIDGPFDLAVLITETVELTEELLEETASAEEDLVIESLLDDLVTEEESEAETEEESEAVQDAREAEESTDTGEETDTAETAESRLAVFTTSSLLEDSMNTRVSGGNYQLFVNTLSWACNQESSVSVPAKSISYDYLTLTAAAGNFWSIVTIVIIPGIILALGLGIWLSRRKR